jgi:predicted permease
VLALIGCGAGLAFALLLLKAASLFNPAHHMVTDQLRMIRNAPIQAWTLIFTLAACALATILSSVLPAASFSRLPLEQELRASSPHASGRESTWRRILVGGQIGLAIVLLFTATALSRSFVKLLDVSPGFSPDHVWTGNISMPETRQYLRGALPAGAPQSRANFYSSFFEELALRVAALPGIQSASACVSLPFSSGGYTADLYFPGRPEPANRPAARFNIVLPKYIETMKIPLIEGRTFTARDDQTSPFTAIVDRAFVQKYFPGEDPIGKLVANNGERDKPYQIVGVVGSVANRDLAENLRPEIYIPALQHPNSAMFLVARTKGDEEITSAVRDTLRSMDSGVALFHVETMSQRVEDSLRLRRFAAWLLNSFAFTGVLLAMLGLYGTLAHLVELRRREIAIRMALGASPRSVRSLVARHSLYIALGGLIPGAIFSFAAIRATQSFLFGISPLDGWTVAAALLGFFALALLASWIPVMRATRINALLALREE